MLLHRFRRCRLRTRKPPQSSAPERAQERGDGSASARRAKVEDEAGMTGEAGTAATVRNSSTSRARRYRPRREERGPALSGLQAGLEQRQEALPLELPADQGDPVP